MKYEHDPQLLQACIKQLISAWLATHFHEAAQFCLLYVAAQKQDRGAPQDRPRQVSNLLEAVGGFLLLQVNIR